MGHGRRSGARSGGCKAPVISAGMGNSGSAVKVCTDHQGGINWLSLSPDGQRLLTGSEDGTARLWSTADSQCHGHFQGTADAFRLGFESEAWHRPHSVLWSLSVSAGQPKSCLLCFGVYYSNVKQELFQPKPGYQHYRMHGSFYLRVC